jgi:hypothetical protein
VPSETHVKPGSARRTGIDRGPQLPGKSENTPAQRTPQNRQRPSLERFHSPIRYRPLQSASRDIDGSTYYFPVHGIGPAVGIANPFRTAMQRALLSVEAGVDLFDIFQVAGTPKCTGTSGPRWPTIHCQLFELKPGVIFSGDQQGLSQTTRRFMFEVKQCVQHGCKCPAQSRR